MLARVQQLLSLAMLAVVIAWAIGCAIAGRPVLALLAPLLIFLGHGLFLAFEFGCLAIAQKFHLSLSPTFRQLRQAWWGEVMAAAPIFFWRQPFRAQQEADYLPAQVSGQRGVVLVHGFFCNRGFWTPWLRRLRARNVPFVAVSLEPVFGSIERYLLSIDEAVRKLELATGQPPVIVGHSMGGLAIRAWLNAFAADSRVHRIVTIGSPHQGTWLARWAHTVNGKQMRLNSAWLGRLQADEPTERYERFTCFYGHCDNIVFPGMTATLTGADNRHLPATAHVHMAFQPVVFDEVCRWLALPAGSVTGA